MDAGTAADGFLAAPLGTDVTAMTDDRPKKPRLFSRSALALGVALLAVLGLRGFDLALKRQAARAIEAQGGVVYYSDERLYDPNIVRGYKALAKEFVFARRPVLAGLSGRHVTDVTIDDNILALGSLQTVGLTNVSVTDAALARLASLRGLRSITCTRDARNWNVLNALDESTQIECTDAPLGDLVLYLSDYHNLRITIDQGALAAASLSEDEPLTYETLREIKLGEALDELLAPHNLGWIVRDGALVVTSRQVADRARQVAGHLKQALPHLKEIKIDAN
jgi:hypothetical protein